MSKRDESTSGNTELPDSKVVVDDECVDSGYLSSNIVVSSENIRDDELSESFARVGLDSDARRNQQQVQTISKDIPWQVLFTEDEVGDTQLHAWALRGCVDSVSAIVLACPARDLLDLQNDYEQTALHLAVLGGHHRVVRALVQAGASVGYRDWTGETPLHIAATYGHKSCMQALLAPLPDSRPHVTSAMLNQKNYNGQTSMHCAALRGHVELVKMLVYYGADVNVREGLGGYSALHVAAERGDTALAAYLLDCPAAAVGQPDYAGRTARRLALRTRVAALFATRPLRDDEDYCPSSDDDDDDDEDVLSMFNSLASGMDRSIPVV